MRLPGMASVLEMIWRPIGKLTLSRDDETRQRPASHSGRAASEVTSPGVADQEQDVLYDFPHALRPASPFALTAEANVDSSVSAYDLGGFVTVSAAHTVDKTARRVASASPTPRIPPGVTVLFSD